MRAKDLLTALQRQTTRQLQSITRQRLKQAVAILSLLCLGVILLLESPLLAHSDQSSGTAPRPLTEAEQRGKRIFLTGVAFDGNPIVGFVGEDAVELPGAAAACAQCHGRTGSGSREGGIRTPGIMAAQLFAPFKGTSDGTAVARPAHDDKSLADAIRLGRSATGQMLSLTMPRYDLRPQDLQDLIAYLHRLGEDVDPGITPQTLKLGAALPLTGRFAPIGEDVKAVLQAYFSEVNQAGGLFRRQLELQVADTGDLVDAGPAGRGKDATEKLLEAGVFALAGSVRLGTPASDRLLETERVPLVAPVALAPPPSQTSKMVFYLYPGFDAQARVVVQHLAANSTLGRDLTQRLLIVQAGDQVGTEWLRGAQAEAKRRSLPPPSSAPYVAGKFNAVALATTLRQQRATAILFAGAGRDLVALVTELDRLGDRTPIYAPASVAGRDSLGLPQALAERVRFVYPAPVGDRVGPGATDFMAFLQRHSIAPRNLAFQINAYASARIMVEALKRAGADLSRETLLTALESFQDFETGVTPPVSYSANRRVAVLGAYLVQVDPLSKQFVRASEWVALAPQ